MAARSRRAEPRGVWPTSEHRCRFGRSQPLLSTARKHKPCAYRGADDLITQRGSGEIVEAIAGALADDDIFGINSAKFGNRLADVVVVERRHDVKPADDGEYLVDAGGGDCGAYRVDDAAMATGGEHDK